MKKRIPTFVAGALAGLMIMSISIGTLAATGALTIEVNPINVQVNGQTFQPKDAQGNSVPVFSYNGTTYAPLRALAEAYGLEVGYDAGKNMATVGEKGSAETPTTPKTPDTANSGDYSDWTAEEEKAYQEFKGMWDVDTSRASEIGVKLTAKESLSKADMTTWFTNAGESTVIKLSNRYSYELIKQFVIPTLQIEGVYNTVTSYYFEKIFLWQHAVNQIGDKNVYNGNTYDLLYVTKQLN